MQDPAAAIAKLQMPTSLYDSKYCNTESTSYEQSGIDDVDVWKAFSVVI